MRILLSSCVLALLAGAAHGQQARAIIEKAVQAHGGMDA